MKKCRCFQKDFFIFLTVIVLSAQGTRGMAGEGIVSGSCVAQKRVIEKVSQASGGLLLAFVPRKYISEVKRALDEANGNKKELLKAINGVDPVYREGVAFLIANMPQRDLKVLKSGFLMENVRLAYQVLNEVPWGRQIPREIFLNDVLPYASLNERRDNWRADFHRRFLTLARQGGSIAKAVRILNEKAFSLLSVTYGTQRPKPDQSPYESMDAGYASCTGLSILLVDVLRSVGIPARVAGTPQWNDNSGNHTWVEVWDGVWHYIGAEEPGPYDETWFKERAAQADASDAEHRIYATSFRRTRLSFPLVWNRHIDDVWAVDVTARYRKIP